MTTDTTDETIRTADVVLLAAGQVLLIKRGWAPYKGCWALPGGHVDTGETSLAAAARELEEETGIAVSTAELRKVASYDAPGRDPRGRYATVAYTATLPSPVPPRAGDDASAARWWPLDALPHLAFDHAEILADAAPR
ncbi:NUDIX domain-containing protein [Streptomyces sp. NEAU-174]|uniref:NUDIX domain-containing protein n=1 Tax=Streptomyces sp. NEAU-174 TaxID=3458254 RepID=UPI004044620D